MLNTSCLGAGLGLRIPHIKTVLTERPNVPWFEVHVCNFLGGGLNRKLLNEIAQHYPLSFHSVSLNLGGTDPINKVYLNHLKKLTEELQPGLVSCHASFTAHDKQHFHDLLPIPFTELSLNNMVERVNATQNFLDRTLLVENVSRYYAYNQSDMSEAEFLHALCKRTGCQIIFDINNAYVNQHNLGEDITVFINDFPKEYIGEIHLAGHSKQDDKLIDTHATHISKEVWQYFKKFKTLSPHTPTLIEWDNNLPEFNTLMSQLNTADNILNDLPHAN